MGTLIYPTEFRETGPLLLAPDDLLELDELASSEWERLANHETELIESAVAEQTATCPDRVATDVRQRVRLRIEEHRQRSLTIFLPGARRLVAHSFADAMKHHEMLRETPIGFCLQMRRAEVRLRVEVLRGAYEKVQIEATPEESEHARQAFGAIRNWLEKVRLPAWQRFWASGADLLVPGVWIAYAILAFLLLVTSLGSDNTAALTAQAHGLLKDGLTAPEQNKAIELLLALASRYDIGGEPRGMTGRGWLILVCGAVVCLAVSIPPKTTIGIGRGRVVVKRWRAWTRFVGVTVPTMVFGNVVWPQIQQLISSMWGR